MVLYDPERRWLSRAICRPDDFPLFFADGGVFYNRPGPRTAEKWAQAKEICAMCPVISECRRDTLGEEYGVFGGLDQYERAVVRKNLTRTMDKWPESRRMTWAREIVRLRELGKSWAEIQTMSGVPRSASQKFVSIWEASTQEKKPGTAAIVDLPLPEPVTNRAEFPLAPGRRHAWVRHNGVIADAWYRGETEDGKWVYVTVYAGRGQVHKWIPVEDACFYRPQTPIITEYIGRPDDDSPRNPAA